MQFSWKLILKKVTSLNYRQTKVLSCIACVSSRCSLSLMLAKTKASPKKEAFLANFGHFCWRQLKLGNCEWNILTWSDVPQVTGDACNQAKSNCLRRAQISRVTKVSYSRGRRDDWRSSDSALGYFISKITSQQHKMLEKNQVF